METNMLLARADEMIEYSPPPTASASTPSSASHTRNEAYVRRLLLATADEVTGLE
jgi:hypothetical protein